MMMLGWWGSSSRGVDRGLCNRDGCLFCGGGWKVRGGGGGRSSLPDILGEGDWEIILVLDLFISFNFRSVLNGTSDDTYLENPCVHKQCNSQPPPLYRHLHINPLHFPGKPVGLL